MAPINRNITKNNIIKTNYSVTDIGLTAIICYIAMFSYIYINAYFNKKIPFGLSLTSEGKRNFLLYKTIIKTPTIPIILTFIIFILLSFWVLIEQKFQLDILGILVLVINALFLLILTAAIFSRTKNKFFYVLLGISMYISIILYSLLSMLVYDKYYPNDNIDELQRSVYTQLAIFVIILFVFLFYFYLDYNKNKTILKYMVSDTLSFLEITFITLFGITFYIISTYPPLE